MTILDKAVKSGLWWYRDGETRPLVQQVADCVPKLQSCDLTVVYERILRAGSVGIPAEISHWPLGPFRPMWFEIPRFNLACMLQQERSIQLLNQQGDELRSCEFRLAWAGADSRVLIDRISYGVELDDDGTMVGLAGPCRKSAWWAVGDEPGHDVDHMTINSRDPGQTLRSGDESGDPFRSVIVWVCLTALALMADNIAVVESTPVSARWAKRFAERYGVAPAKRTILRLHQPTFKTEAERHVCLHYTSAHDKFYSGEPGHEHISGPGPKTIHTPGFWSGNIELGISLGRFGQDD